MLCDYLCVDQGSPILITRFTSFNDLPGLGLVFFKIPFRIYFLSFDIDLLIFFYFFLSFNDLLGYELCDLFDFSFCEVISISYLASQVGRVNMG